MIPDSWQRRTARRLADAEAAGLRRRLALAYDACGVERTIDGRRYLCFSSNDYLGLAAEPAVREALRSAADHWGLGSGAAQLLGGHTTAHRALEERLADWIGKPRALLLSTGYQANLALLGALLRRGDLVCADRLNHASLLDAARLSGARLRRYLHADANSLRRRLAGERDGLALVATDSVFSMDGDRAPLDELAVASAEAQALFVVDDAHAFGVLGERGRGLGSAAGADLVMATLGKALGGFGAFVAGPSDLIDCLVQFGRAYIYTTAPPPALAAATLVAAELARSQDWRREKLFALIARLRNGASQLGIELLASDTPIQPLVLRSPERATRVASALAERGLWVPAVRPPTVPPKSARLRISLSAAHEEAHVDRLLDALAEVL